jgi:hypothetical protein
LTGIAITQSAITQDALKQAEGPVGAAYQEFRERVRHAPVTYTDDCAYRKSYLQPAHRPANQMFDPDIRQRQMDKHQKSTVGLAIRNRSCPCRATRIGTDPA